MNGVLERKQRPGEEHFERAEKIIAEDNTLIPPFWINKYKKEAARNWDIFYKRNQTKFFRDRHWVAKEFDELAPIEGQDRGQDKAKVLLEAGCGVGNFLFPRLEANPNMYIFACDFSPRAIDFVKNSEAFDPLRCKPFVCDITHEDALTKEVGKEMVDIASMIFVLSAIAPENHAKSIQHIASTLKPGGTVLFRDYAVFDEAQIRFSKKKESKLADNLYVRGDDIPAGTMSYFFSTQELEDLFTNNGFTCATLEYVYRETTNRAEDIAVDRIYIQGRFVKT
ncbi:hypothetical protein BZG36_03761 [Bifiguratus adelaidae]|uniref:tRNA N(3)-methylcytidine methyltransferase n=1 Tax=Bifiguratus adelaidae TaxID=1938954 RepID=A0A261Y0A5_9FUNG|nr:hypothetical protein BZG36_03761 [Bifiguratus adelaidae]